MPHKEGVSSENTQPSHSRIASKLWIAIGIGIVVLVSFVIIIKMPDENTLNGVKLEYKSPGVSYRIGDGATSMANKYSGEAFGPHFAPIYITLFNKNNYSVSATVKCIGTSSSKIRFENIPPHEKINRSISVEVGAGGKYGEQVIAHIGSCSLIKVAPVNPEVQNAVIGSFTLAIPKKWTEYSGEEGYQLHLNYLEQFNQTYKHFAGTDDSWSFNPSAFQFKAFHVPGGEGSFMIVTFNVPHESNRIHTLKAQAEDKMRFRDSAQIHTEVHWLRFNREASPFWILY